MRLKRGFKLSTSNFWKDLSQTGFLDPEKICLRKEDADDVKEAIMIIRDFERSCEEQIEGWNNKKF